MERLLSIVSVVLAWEREIKPDPDKVNVNGGAIALGHPLGASGARLITTIVHELEKRKARYGLITLCIMHGMAVATIIEREESSTMRSLWNARFRAIGKVIKNGSTCMTLRGVKVKGR